MDVNKSRAKDALLRRLTSVGLVHEHAQAFSDNAARFSDRRPTFSIIAERGEFPRPPTYLFAGWAIRQIYLEQGERHIPSFLLPGDPLFPFACIGEQFSFEIVAITEVTVANLRERQTTANPDTMTLASVRIARQHLLFARNHMLRLGSHSAYQRVGHLLLELFDRLSQVGLTYGQSCTLPLTQEMVGNALGISVVHVNRCFRQLREAGLVRKVGNRLDLLDGPKLMSLTDYQPVAGATEFRL